MRQKSSEELRKNFYKNAWFNSLEGFFVISYDNKVLKSKDTGILYSMYVKECNNQKQPVY
jgi:hypothetical protein